MASKKISNRAIRTIGIFIDGQNLYHAQIELGVNIDYGKMICYIEKWFTEKREKSWIEFVRYYGLDVSSFCASPAYNSFIKNLKEWDIDIIGKDFKHYRKNGYSYRKLDLDLDIAVDAMRLTNKYNTLVLISGDKDFNCLLKLFKSLGKNICVVSSRKSLSKELKKSSHVTICLDNILKEIKL